MGGGGGGGKANFFFRKSKLKENGVAICSGVDSGGCVVRFDVHGE